MHACSHHFIFRRSSNGPSTRSSTRTLLPSLSGDLHASWRCRHLRRNGASSAICSPIYSCIPLARLSHRPIGSRLPACKRAACTRQIFPPNSTSTTPCWCVRVCGCLFRALALPFCLSLLPPPPLTAQLPLPSSPKPTATKRPLLPINSAHSTSQAFSQRPKRFSQLQQHRQHQHHYTCHKSLKSLSSCSRRCAARKHLQHALERIHML